MTTRTALLLTALLAPLAGCAPKEAAAPPPASPAAEVVGEALNCLPLRNYTSTVIRDDYTIDFIGAGRSKVWRVTLPNRCSGLRMADSFTYETSLSQLCRNDIIYPLQRYGNRLERGAGCGLGPFVPVKLKP